MPEIETVGPSRIVRRPARRILVTGGAGFIGSALAEAIMASGDQVAIVDTVPGPRQARRVRVLADAGVEIVQGDLTTLDLRHVLDGTDAVVHMAGRPGVQPSWGGEFARYLQDNVLATQCLLDAALDRPVRVVLASSSSVYGNVPEGCATEDAPLRPLSPYGVSKAAVEQLMGAYVARGVDAVALRYFSVYGRAQRPDMAVSLMLDSACGGPPFRLRGDGTQARDLTHVDDVVRATMAAIGAELEAGSVLNVGSGRPVSLLEVLSRLEQLLERPIPVDQEPDAAGDPCRTAAGIARADELLGWRPQVSLTDGLNDQREHHVPSWELDRSVATRR